MFQLNLLSLLRPDRDAEYIVRSSVCLSVHLSQEPAVKFTRLAVRVARGCGRGLVLLWLIRYVFPVLWMTSSLPIMGLMAA